MGTVPQPQPIRPKRRRFLLILLLLPLLGVASIPVATEHLRAASLLLRIQNPEDHSRLARYHTYAVAETLANLGTPSGVVRARFYKPVGASNPPGMVVVHGVHHLGIDEPRLVAFSRALCASGIQVFTPELPQLADYQVSHASVDNIGAATEHFSRLIRKRVGLLGLSFAGGEALLTAADPKHADSVAFVVSIGSHDDMRRVADFYASGRILRPDGAATTLKPHEYGPLVLMYSHPEEFFPPADVKQSREVLRLLLWERVEDSKQAAQRLSPQSLALMQHIYAHDDLQIRSQLEAVIGRHAQEMAQVSPHGQLTNLRVPVLLLHGEIDDVIPATEMLWLEKDVPPEYLREALVTPLLNHVSIAAEPPLRQKVALLHFMAELFELADESRSSSLQRAN